MVDAGYGSSSRFYERAVARLGMLPTIYKQGGAGMNVGYTIVDSPLGRLLVAATTRGVCAVAMGRSDVALQRALALEYPGAVIAKDRGALSGWTTEILAHLSGRRPRLDLPLDVQATAFQWQVWNALAAIPRGETRSYAAGRFGDRPPERGTRRRACVRDQPCRARDSLSSRRAGRRWRRRLSLGDLAKKGAARR